MFHGHHKTSNPMTFPINRLEQHIQVWYIVTRVQGHVRGLLLSNTLKIKRLENQSYRKERNFIDRERLSREVYNRVWKLGAL
jgi:hypothetical protein